MEERAAFNRRVRTTVAYALMLIGLYFIMAAINGLLTSVWDVGSLFGIIGLVMFILGYMFTHPRLKIKELGGFTLIGVGTWSSLRAVANFIESNSSPSSVNGILNVNQGWLWALVTIICFALGWLLMSAVLNTPLRRQGAFLMVGSGLIFALAIGLIAVQSLVSFAVLLVSVLVFARGYKTFNKNN